MIYLLGILITLAAVVIHYEALNALSAFIGKKKRHHRYDMLIVVIAVVIAHLLETAVYAVTYWIRADRLEIDRFNLKPSWDFVDYCYFSIETYTALGYGNFYLLGDARFLSSMETLIGLILLGWTASFFFLIMSRHWSRKLSVWKKVNEPE